MVNALRERPQAGARGARRRGMPARPPRACAAPPDAAAAAPAGHAAGPARDVLYPFPEFAAKAHVSSREMYDDMYALSVADPSRFWGDQARQFHWETPVPAGGSAFGANLDVRAGPVYQRWFGGGTTNVAYNCLDRQVARGLGDKAALLWEGNDPGHHSALTYSQLLASVCQLANYLRLECGVGPGDIVVAYLPMRLELPVLMLACARLGAVHSVVFGGFSADALAQRVVDCRPRCVVTCTAVRRGAKPIPLKAVVDAALALAAEKGVTVPVVLVAANESAGPGAGAGSALSSPGRDVWWHDAVPRQATACPVAWVDAEHPLFMLYTSGSTGKPKGVVHTTGGYMVHAATTFRYVFDAREGDVYWCTADCGWITGHSYLTYGPLLNGATQVVFEGVPTWPDAGRMWQIIDKYQVSLFYTAPTLVRSLERLGDAPVKASSRASLRVLGTVGEPINPAAWEWFFTVVGDSRCPIVDTWWQTETGGHMITPLPGAHALKPGSAGLPFFGVVPALLDGLGHEIVGPGEGVLVLKAAWPGAARTLFEDSPRFEATYYAPYPGYFYTSDGARRDADGYYTITGRVDDVINVSGHRIGTAEVESALVANPSCAEAAVVGVDHPIKGQGIYAFVSLMAGVAPSDALRKQLVDSVRASIGAFASPDTIHWAPALPKTRSGKIMRRVLRKIAANELDQLGDTSTLSDPGVVDELVALRGK